MSKSKTRGSGSRNAPQKAFDSPGPDGPEIPAKDEIVTADDGQPDSQLDQEMLDDCDYVAVGGWVHPVCDLVTLLHVFGGPWLFHADRLATLLREAQNLALEKEHGALHRIRTELASVQNKGGGGLSQDRLSQLRAALGKAIKQTIHRLNAIPNQREREERAVVHVGAWLKTSDAFRELRQIAANELKGIERRIVELVCDGNGSCPLRDLAMDSGIAWEVPYDNAFNSAKQRINDKLKKRRWQIYRHDSNAKARNLVRK
jgi:hypothetical protein